MNEQPTRLRPEEEQAIRNIISWNVTALSVESGRALLNEIVALRLELAAVAAAVEAHQKTPPGPAEVVARECLMTVVNRGRLCMSPTPLAIRCQRAAEFMRREVEKWVSAGPTLHQLFHVVPQLLEEAAAQMFAHEVTWIVNRDGEFGVRVGTHNYWYYKWPTTDGADDEEEGVDWRRVNKREFGETIKASHFGTFDFGSLAPLRADSVVYATAEPTDQEPQK